MSSPDRSPTIHSFADSQRSLKPSQLPQSPQSEQQQQPQQPPPRKMLAAQDIVFGLTNAVAAALCISGGVANVLLFKLSYRPLLICALSGLSGLLLLLLEVAPRLSPWTTTHLGFLQSFSGRGIAYIILACFQFDTPLLAHDAWLYANAAGLAALGVLYIGLGVVDAFSGEDGIPKPRSMHTPSQCYKPTSRGMDVEAGGVPMQDRRQKAMSYVSTTAGSRLQEAGLLSHDVHARRVQRSGGGGGNVASSRLASRPSSRPGTANSRTSEFARSFWPRPSSAQSNRRDHAANGSVSTLATGARASPDPQHFTQETIVVQSASEGDQPELYFRALSFDEAHSNLPTPSASAQESREPSLRLKIPPAGPRRPKTATSATPPAQTANFAEASHNWRNSMPSGLSSVQRSSRQHRTVSVAGVGDIELSSESESEDEGEVEDEQFLDSPKSVYGDTYEEAELKRKATLKQKRLAKIERGVERTLSMRADKSKRAQALRDQAAR